MERFDRNLSVLIVDDVRAPRRVLRKLLGEFGITNVIETETGRDALNCIKSQKPSMIICDYNLTDMKGVEILKRIRSDEEMNQTPFILITSEVSETEVRFAQQEGVSAYMLKPFSLDSLYDNVQVALTNPVPLWQKANTIMHIK